jgi:hypothetical protein
MTIICDAETITIVRAPIPREATTPTRAARATRAALGAATA